MYERTYHKAVLKSEEKGEKKPGRINWKKIFLIVGAVAIIALSIVLIKMPRLQVQHIEVSGEQVADPDDVTEFINTQLKGHTLFILPRTSIFLIPVHTLENKLKIAFPRFQNVTISRKNFSTLSINVTEYQGIYLWCVDDATCYFMDQNGTVFAPAPYFSGSAYPKIFVGPIQDVPFQAVTQTQLNTISLLLQRLPTISIVPTEFHFVSDHELDIDFNHEGQQAVIMIDPTEHIPELMQSLYTALRTNPLATKFRDPTQVLQYIDLRFSNRVVYKFQ